MLRQHSRLLEFLVEHPLSRWGNAGRFLLVLCYLDILLASLNLYPITFYSLLVYSFVAH